MKNKKQENKKAQTCYFLLSFASFDTLCLAYSVCLCIGHFVMVPNLTCPQCLQHFFFEHLFHLYLRYPIPTIVLEFKIESGGVGCFL